jgi:hypothetical protein
MAKEKINAPRISLIDFLNASPEMKAGKVELLGGFAHWMESIKGITQDTEDGFKNFLEQFKNLEV